MNILVASAEVAPFAKMGGLADVTGTLPKEWKKYGQNPIVIMPKYGSIDVHKYGFEPTELTIKVPMGHWNEYARLWFGYLPNSEVPVYLIEHEVYFSRSGIYGDPEEYPDNDRRFIFYSRAVFESARVLNFAPDIIHAHDYHTAFTLAFLKSYYKHDPFFSRAAGVYTIHNLAYQGWFNPQRAMEFSGFDIKEIYPGSWFEHQGSVNAMKVGIMFADKVTTVSPTYAHEIRYPYFSEGLQEVLNLRGGDLVGILNGVYYDEWNPMKDVYIHEHYDSNNLEIKTQNKIHFLKEFGLTDADDLAKPLIGIVTRLTDQKGIDLIINKMDNYLAHNSFRFILLGSGDQKQVDYFRFLEKKYPKNAIINIGYDNSLAHKIIACSDFYLMPSRFEPCGLTQMYAMSYGTIPIVRMTGGLADTVKEYIPESGNGTGFLFWQYNADDMAYAIRRALTVYHQETHWNLIRTNAMAQKFPSNITALEYLKVFKWALEKVR